MSEGNVSDTGSGNFTKETLDQPKFNPINLFCLVPLLGLWGNILFMSYLLQHRVGTRISFILLRVQTMIDGIICICTTVEILQKQFWTTGYAALDKPICYLWHSQFLYWYLINCSIYTLILTVMDRFIFVVLPLHYKKRKSRHIYIPLSIIYSLGVPHTGLMMMEAGFTKDPNQCVPSFNDYNRQHPFLIYFRQFLGVSWFIFDYLLPTVSIVVLYFFIIMALRRSRNNRHKKNLRISSRFTLATLIISVIMSMSTSYDAMYYLLMSFKVIEVNYFDQKYNKIGIILSALNSSVNPYVFLILMPSFRRYVTHLLQCSVGMSKRTKYNSSESVQYNSLNNGQARSV